MREFRIHPWLFAALTAASVVAIGVLAAVVTSLFHQGPKKQCVVNCPPPVARAEGADFLSPAERAYHSPAGFDVRYPSSWAAHGLGRGGISLDTDDGGFFEVRPAVGASPAQLIVDRVRALDPQTFPDLKPLGTIRGAHVGGVSGVGTLYGGTMVPGGGGGSAERVRFAIIAAQRNGLAVVVTAADWYDQSVTGRFPTGMPGAQSLDYALIEFRWP